MTGDVTIERPDARVSYRAFGPEESVHPPVVFVHAFVMNGAVRAQVGELLAQRGIRSDAPDWPLGEHRIAVGPAADQSPRGVARLILRFRFTFDLEDVTLVDSGTGGALVQFLLDTDSRGVGRVVLTNCDAFDVFPTFPFSLIFRLLQGPIRVKVNLTPMRCRGFRHSALGFGLLARSLGPEMTRSWIEPALVDAVIRRDAAQFLRAADPQDLLDVSIRLDGFGGAVRIVRGTYDCALTPELGRHLQKALADAEFVEAPGARTPFQLDEPVVLADAIEQVTR